MIKNKLLILFLLLSNLLSFSAIADESKKKSLIEDYQLNQSNETKTIFRNSNLDLNFFILDKKKYGIIFNPTENIKLMEPNILTITKIGAINYCKENLNNMEAGISMQPINPYTIYFSCKTSLKVKLDQFNLNPVEKRCIDYLTKNMSNSLLWSNQKCPEIEEKILPIFKSIQSTILDEKKYSNLEFITKIISENYSEIYRLEKNLFQNAKKSQNLSDLQATFERLINPLTKQINEIKNDNVSTQKLIQLSNPSNELIIELENNLKMQRRLGQLRHSNNKLIMELESDARLGQLRHPNNKLIMELDSKLESDTKMQNSLDELRHPNKKLIMELLAEQTISQKILMLSSELYEKANDMIVESNINTCKKYGFKKGSADFNACIIGLINSGAVIFN